MDFRMRRFKRRTSIEVKPQQTMQPKAKQKQRRPSWRPRWEFSSLGPPGLREKPKKPRYITRFLSQRAFFWLAKKGNTAKVVLLFGVFGLLSSSSSTHTSADKRRGRALGKAPPAACLKFWLFQHGKVSKMWRKFWLSFLVWHILFCWLQDSLFIIGALFRRTKPRARNTFKVQILGNNDNWDWTYDTHNFGWRWHTLDA